MNKLTEKDYVTSYLSCLKDMEKNVVIAMTESSNDELYNIYKDMFLEISSLQREVFQFMNGKGWYELSEEDSYKIEDKLVMLNKEFNELEI